MKKVPFKGLVSQGFMRTFSMATLWLVKWTPALNQWWRIRVLWVGTLDVALLASHPCKYEMHEAISNSQREIRLAH